MSVLEIFKMAWKFKGLIPLVVQLILMAEAAIPGEGKGEKKLKMVREYLEEFWKGAEDSYGDFASAWEFIQRIINRFVPILTKD